MAMQEAKFIGGSKDGHIIQVPTDKNEMFFPIYSPPTFAGSVSVPPIEHITRHEVYRRVDSDTFQFWGEG